MPCLSCTTFTRLIRSSIAKKRLRGRLDVHQAFRSQMHVARFMLIANGRAAMIVAAHAVCPAHPQLRRVTLPMADLVLSRPIKKTKHEGGQVTSWPGHAVFSPISGERCR